MLRAAVLGANRGELHALAYKGLDGMELVAMCDKDVDKVTTLCANLEKGGFNHVEPFFDYEDMLKQEKPDIVHIVTSPTITRDRWIEPAYRAGVKCLVLEKPYALTPDEKLNVDSLVYKYVEMIVLVNHQRRYFQFAIMLRDLLDDGFFGEIRHVHVQSQGEIMEMGTHAMDLLLMVMGDNMPDSIWASAYGAKSYQEQHLRCPDNLLALLTFGNTRAILEVTTDPITPPDYRNVRVEHQTCHHANRLSLYVYGTDGYFWWREYGNWGFKKFGDKGTEMVSDYFDDDMPAQRGFTRAIKNTVEKHEPHECSFLAADVGLSAIFLCYRSALSSRRIEYGNVTDQVGYDRHHTDVMKLVPHIIASDDYLELRNREWHGLKDRLEANG